MVTDPGPGLPDSVTMLQQGLAMVTNAGIEDLLAVTKKW